MNLKVTRCVSDSGKHKWEFVKNRNKVSYSSCALFAKASMKLLGVYRCTHCGQRKTGPSRIVAQ